MTTTGKPQSDHSPELELTPEKYEYIGPNKIRVTFRTGLGDLMVTVMTAASLIQTINMADTLFSAHPKQILKDLRLF